jgi:transposase-like protein
MNPQSPFCHKPQCPARGQVGQGNRRGHRPTEQRDRGITCGQTFAATKGTPCSRLRTTAALVTTVLTLLGHGGPIQALVAAFGLEARTVAAWLARAGQHGPQRPQPVVQQGQVDGPHVQADELGVTRVGRRGWMAMAMAVPSRRWLGGVRSPQRDWPLRTTLGQLVRSCAGSLAILGGVDGWARDVTAFRHVVRHPVRPGRRGRPRLVLAEGLLLGHMVKRDARRRVVRVERRVVRRDRAGHRSGAGGHPNRPRQQHRGPRAAERDLPRVPGAPGTPGTRHRPHRGGADRRDVAGGVCVQLLRAA